MRIHLVSPSSPATQEALTKGSMVLQAHAEIVSTSTPRTGPFPYLNGSDQERHDELAQALQSDVDAVWQIRGGYGITRILPLLHLNKAPHPTFVGFSDATALHCALWQQFRKPGLHADGVTRFDTTPPEVLQATMQILQKDAASVRYPDFQALEHAKKVEGILFPVNICVLTDLIGTPYLPQFDDGILMLEEITERPYRIDRMLTQWLQAGVLNGVKAVVLGSFKGCTDSDVKDPYDVIVERLAPLGIPIFGNFALGHEHPNWPVPFGLRGRIDVNGTIAQLHLIEELP